MSIVLRSLSCKLLRLDKTIKLVDPCRLPQFTGALSDRGSCRLISKEERIAILAKPPEDRTIKVDGVTYWPVFRYPLIPFVAGLAKFKIFATALTVTIGIFASVTGVPLGSFYVTALSTSTVTLILFSEVFRRSLGFIYLDESGTTARISTTTFLGRRYDFNVPVRDIVPLTETHHMLRKSEIWRVLFYKDSEAASKIARYLIVFSGARGIINPTKFRIIFGNVDIEKAD